MNLQHFEKFVFFLNTLRGSEYQDPSKYNLLRFYFPDVWLNYPFKITNLSMTFRDLKLQNLLWDIFYTSVVF